MLKRYQVLLEDWMADHYKLTSNKYDVSFSEMIRMALCVDIIQATKTIFPKYHAKKYEQRVKKVIGSRDIAKIMDKENFHSLLSKIYFEARKATELLEKKTIKDISYK